MGLLHTSRVTIDENAEIEESWLRGVKCLKQNVFQCPLPLTMMVSKLHRMYLQTATLAYLAPTIKLTSDIWKPITQKAIMLPRSCISMTGFRNASNFFTKLKYINSLCYNFINIRNCQIYTYNNNNNNNYYFYY